MRPSSSGIVLALTIVPGILESFLIIQLKTIFPMSRLTRKLHKNKDTAETFFKVLLASRNTRMQVMIWERGVKFAPNRHNLGEE